jgi:hypothetical protein
LDTEPAAHMPKKAPTQTFNLHHPGVYTNTCMANRYAVDHEKGFTVADFGLLNRAGVLIDRFTFIIPDYTLEMQKESLVPYSDKIGPAKKAPPSWTAPSVGPRNDWSTLSIVDFIHVSHWADAHAEIGLWNYSQGSVADLLRAGHKEALMPWGVALIRCDLDLQRSFLTELYAE